MKIRKVDPESYKLAEEIFEDCRSPKPLARFGPREIHRVGQLFFPHILQPHREALTLKLLEIYARNIEEIFQAGARLAQATRN